MKKTGNCAVKYSDDNPMRAQKGPDRKRIVLCKQILMKVAWLRQYSAHSHLLGDLSGPGLSKQPLNIYALQRAKCV